MFAHWLLEPPLEAIVPRWLGYKAPKESSAPRPATWATLDPAERAERDRKTAEEYMRLFPVNGQAPGARPLR
jgi:hypothetical protein